MNKIFTYRYLFKLDDTEDGKINVKIVTDTQQGLEAFEKSLLEEGKVLACMKEYICEYDLSFLGMTTTIKEFKKESE